MATKLRQAPADYEEDFFLWSETQAEALRARRLEDLDWENLAEEIESLGRSDKREIRSRLIVLLTHLLKWQIQPGARCGSWRGNIREQRRQLRELLDESPSLRSRFESSLPEVYDHARNRAIDETALVPELFPTDCPFRTASLLDDDYLPD